ncbi:hypothetical protein ACW9HO_35565 [Nocardia gipuzkoensis]
MHQDIAAVAIGKAIVWHAQAVNLSEHGLLRRRKLLRSSGAGIRRGNAVKRANDYSFAFLYASMMSA